MRSKLAFLLLALAPALACRAVAVGSIISYNVHKTNQERQQFMAQLQHTNTDRESKGLKPLTWCSQAYRFDRGWAESDPECEKMIELYEKGDKTALDSVVVMKPAFDSTADKKPPK
jgi:hypothetical protein